MVDIGGDILSEQDGMFYPTGQSVAVTFLMMMLEW